MTKARDLGDFISDGTIAETVTADGLNLGDNEKIQLGASQDLQLYHDGTHSRIDNNQGDLFIQSDTIVRITNSAASETAAKFFVDGAVELYHDNSRKIKTLATGAEVTGTIAVSGDFNATSGTFTVQSNGTDILNVTSTLMSPQTDGAISLGSASNAFNNMYLDGSAYVSGNVGIGTSSPGMTLDVDGSGGPNDIVRFSGPNSGGITFRNSTSNELVMHTATSDALIFGTNGNNERMRIDSSGNVGIGTSSPSFENGGGLEVNYSSGNGAHLKLTDAASGSGGTNGLDLYAFNTSGYIENYELGALVFRNAGAERFRIAGNGQWGLSGANYGTSGQVLTSGGSGAAPTWTTISAGAPFSGFGS